MKFFFESEKSLKNGLYLDYFIKNLSLSFYKKIIGTNFLYLLDKYLAEKFFYTLNKFFKFLLNTVNVIKNLQFKQLLKLIIIVSIQILLIVIL